MAILLLVFGFLMVTSISGESCLKTLPIDCAAQDEAAGTVAYHPMKKMDVFFVLDGSSAIEEKTFTLVKQWVTNFIAEFDVGAERSRVGVVTFGSSAIININLQDSGKLGMKKTKKRIRNIKWLGGASRIGLGINAMSQQFQNSGKVNNGIKNVAFIVTTTSTIRQPLEDIIKKARDLGIVLYAIGVGANVKREELVAIAGSKERVFAVDNVARLQEIIPQKIFANGLQTPEARTPCPQVECLLDDNGVPTMRVMLHESIYSETRPAIGICSDMTFNPLPADAKKPGYFYTDIQAGQCGTLFYVFEKDLEYSNVLNLFQESDNGMVIRDEAEFKLKCSYPRKDLKTTIFHPSRRVSDVSSTGVVPMEMEIFNEDFTTMLPKPPIFPLRARIHVQASMATYDKLELFPQNCWTTPGSDPEGAVRKDLIANGCPRERTLETHLPQTPVHTRFSFEAFRFHGGNCTVYIHCELLICKANNPESSCTKGCQEGRSSSSSSRSKRSAPAGSFFMSGRVSSGSLIVADVWTPEVSRTIARNIVSTGSLGDSVDRTSRLDKVGRRLAIMMQSIKRGAGGRRRRTRRQRL